MNRLILTMLAIAALSACTQKISPKLPSPSDSAVSLPDYDSSINIPLSMSLSEINDLVNQSVDRNFSGTQPLSIGGNVHKEKLTWRLSRSSIIVSGAGKSLTVSGKFSGSATASAEYCPGGKLLGCKGVRESISFGGSISGNLSNVHIKPDWSVGAEFNPQINVSKAEIRILGNLIPISVRGHVNKAIKKELPKLKKKFENELLPQLALKEKIEEAYSKMDLAHQLETTPPIWVTVKPKAIGVKPLTVKNNELISGVAMNLSLSTQIGSEVQDPVRTPLPSPTTQIGDKGFILNVPVNANLTAISEKLRECCAAKKYDIDEKHSIFVKDVTLMSDHEKIYILLDFKAKRKDFLGRLVRLFRPISGQLVISANPEWQKSNHILEFTELDYSLDTKNTLVNVAAYLAKPKLLESIQADTVIDLSSERLHLIDQARSAIKSLELGQGLISTSKIHDISIESVKTVPNHLVLVVSAAGVLEIDVNDNQLVRANTE